MITSSSDTKAADTTTSRLEDHLPSETYIPKAMPPILGTFDMTVLYVLALFFVIYSTYAAAGGIVGLVYMFLGAITFFIPCVIAAAQLGVMFPYEGSIYNWTYKALGKYWSFFIGLCFWLVGVLAIVTATNGFVTILQGLNNAWLTQPWQQGLVMLALIAAIGFLGIQRFRMVQNIFNVGFYITLIPVALLVIAVVVWLVTGHPSMTSFNHPADWSINPGNFSLYGLITLIYIGVSGPLNMAGETVGRRVVTRHLLWGTVIVFTSYFLATLAILIIRGQAILNAVILPFEVITTVDVVLGKFAGSIATIGVLGYCIWGSLFYVVTSSRVMLAAAIDQRLPASMGRLNKHRIPANAVVLQTIATGAITAFIFIVAPYTIRLAPATSLATIFYTVNSATLTIVWTIATAFLFVNLIGVYLRDPKGFRRQRIFPMPVIWGSAVVGFTACVLTIVDTLLNSWIAQLIGNDRWWYIVGGLTALCLLVAAIASMFANSEAEWEELSK